MIKVVLNVSEDANIRSIRNAMLFEMYDELQDSNSNQDEDGKIDLLMNTIRQIDNKFGDMWFNENY